MSDEGIFKDCSQTIEKALKAIYERNKSTKNIAKTGFEIALEQLI